jgi:hypothetical protein
MIKISLNDKTGFSDKEGRVFLDSLIIYFISSIEHRLVKGKYENRNTP